MRTPGAPPPALQFFLGRVVQWVVLVFACALPLAIMTWRAFTPTERLAEALGVFLWAVVMVIVGERLHWPSRDDARSLRGVLEIVVWNRWSNREADRQSTMLRAGALVTAIVHASLAVVGGRLALFMWFAPVVLIVSYLPLISEIESEFWMPFTLTLMCGAQSAFVAWLCGRAIDGARRALVRRLD